MLAFDQRRLCFEKMDQGFLIGRQQSACTRRHLARKNSVASAGGDKPGRKCLIPPVALADAEIAGDRVGREPGDADEPDDQKNGRDQRNQKRGADHQAGLDALAHPDQREFARPVREP